LLSHARNDRLGAAAKTASRSRRLAEVVASKEATRETSNVETLRDKRRVAGPHGTWELHVAGSDTGLAWLRPHLHRHRWPGSWAVHIEAIDQTSDERLLWTTTRTSLERVLHEIEEGFVAGKVVQPAGAVYSGARRDGYEPRSTGFVYPDLPIVALHELRCAGMDAYELVEQLPHGEARSAAWNAYALQTYGDKLLVATHRPEFVSQDTAEMAGRLFLLACTWLERASQLSAGSAPRAREELQDTVPTWYTPTRAQDQLVGMRDTLETMRTFIAYDLTTATANASESTLFGLHERLEAVDKRIAEVDLLWVPRLPAELRRGIGFELGTGIDTAYALGRAVASLGQTAGV
jgi:hypothetical protein